MPLWTSQHVFVLRAPTINAGPATLTMDGRGAKPLTPGYDMGGEGDATVAEGEKEAQSPCGEEAPQEEDQVGDWYG
jgi:hypothetical protein